jgi:hypothetical protein
MFHHGQAFGSMEDDVALPALDEFQIEEFAFGIEFGDESVVIGGLRLAVDARDVIALLEGIMYKALGRLQFRYGDLGAEWTDDHNGYDPDKPGRRMADGAYQKGHHGGGSDHKVDGS